MVEQVSSAFKVLQQKRFPCGVLTPDKIGVKIGEDGKENYYVSVDILMNGEIYQNLQILQEPQIRKYLSPE